MLAPVNFPDQIRPLAPSAPGIPQEIILGVPSCAPLVQHELLKAVRDQLPALYTRAARELDLTVSRTQELIDRRVEIVSAARAIKLARMIAYEPNARDVFGEAGHNLFEEMNRGFPRALKAAIRNLPHPLRVRLALAWARKVAYGFAGSAHHLLAEYHRRVIALSVRNGVFADRLDTLGGAHEYYRKVFETMFRELALLDCEVKEIRRPRVYLNQCNYEIVWEA
jgi:bacteriochlorophyll 4-vinyl reductase